MFPGEGLELREGPLPVARIPDEDPPEAPGEPHVSGAQHMAVERDEVVLGRMRTSVGWGRRG